MDNFYVTLPSNVSSKGYFRENTVANYITKLSQRMALEGEWEVGLVEISYTLSWFNIPNKLEIGLLEWNDGCKRITADAYIPPGKYDKINDLISVINLLITQKFRD